MGATVNKFFDTAVGKSVETLLWTLAAYGITVAVALVARFQWSPEMAALGVPGLLNWLLYTAKVVIDKEVPTLPNSTPMKLVPKNSTPVNVVTVPVNLPKDVIDSVTKTLQDDLKLTQPSDATEPPVDTQTPPQGDLAPIVEATQVPTVPPTETAPVDQPQAPVS